MRLKMILIIKNSLIVINIIFALLSLVPIKHAMKAKYKLRHKIASFSLLLIFLCNVYYLLNG